MSHPHQQQQHQQQPQSQHPMQQQQQHPQMMQPPAGFAPMMMPNGQPIQPHMMTPQMMQQQMQFMQMQMQHTMMLMQQQQAQAAHQQHHHAAATTNGQAGGAPTTATAAVPQAGFPMMSMFPMMQPMMQPAVTPVAAASSHPTPSATTTTAAVPTSSPHPVATSVAPIAAAPLMQMPMMMPVMMPHMMPQQQAANWAPVVSKSTAPAPTTVKPTTPTPAPAPKVDAFSDLSNPTLALKKERFVMPQTAASASKPVMPPASVGVRAQDEIPIQKPHQVEDDEEDFADFTSAGEKTDSIQFDLPAATNGKPASTSQSSDLSFDSPHPPLPVRHHIARPIVPAAQPAPTADALMSKAFDLFSHKQNAPLVAQASMKEIASHQPNTNKPPPTAATPTPKSRRELSHDLDDLFSNLVGGESTSQPVELPQLGNMPQPPKPKAAMVAPTVEDDDEDFGDFTSQSATAAATTNGHTQPKPAASVVKDEEEEEEGFGDFTSTAAAAVPLPSVPTITATAIPTSSFAIPPTSSFATPLPTSSFTMPQSSFVQPPQPKSSAQVEDEDEEEEFADFASSAPTVQVAPAAIAQKSSSVQVEEDDEEDETEANGAEEDGGDFADFSSAAPVAASSTATAVPAPLFEPSSDPFGGLIDETPTDAAVASLSPEAVLPIATVTIAPKTAIVEDDNEEDDGKDRDEKADEEADEDEDFADFSSAAPSAAVPPSNEIDFVVTEQTEITIVEVAPVEPAKPKQESDLIGDWGSTKSTKKSNPFAAAPDVAVEPTVIEISPIAPVEAIPPPSLDDVFGSLLSPESDEKKSVSLLPDLPQLNTMPKAKSSLSISQVLAATQNPAPLSARAAEKPTTNAQDTEQEDFGSFASSASDDALASRMPPTHLIPSASFDALKLDTAPPSIAASPAVAFSFSEDANAITMPSSLMVQSRVPRNTTILPREENESEMGGESETLLLQQERFTELRAYRSYQNSAAQLAELNKAYKLALAAAEEDDSEDGVQLAAAMKLQKQIKSLKALKPDPTWSRALTTEEQVTVPASWSQLHRTLISLDPKWDAAFLSLYPDTFSAIATSQDIDAALALQQQANAFVHDILGPIRTEEDRNTHVERIMKHIDYIHKQLDTGLTFVQETSHLDLTDATKRDEFVALLSSPSSSTITFLSGLQKLYLLLLQLEFSNTLFDLGIDQNVFEKSHEVWMMITKHLYSAPLITFLSEWLSEHSIDVDSERQRMNRENEVETRCEHRGRHTCPISLANQPAPGVHPMSQALQAHLL